MLSTAMQNEGTAIRTLCFTLYGQVNLRSLALFFLFLSKDMPFFLPVHRFSPLFKLPRPLSIRFLTSQTHGVSSRH